MSLPNRKEKIMKEPLFASSGYWKLAAVAILTMALAACTALSSDQKKSDQTTAKDTPPPNTVYYDFDDVELPRELEIVRDDSFVYDTTGFTAGVLTLKGRVEFDSLVRFFEANMPKDNWRAVGHIKADSAMMLFHKENRWCVITLEEGSYYTYAHIWVAPTVFTPDAALMPSSAN
jgi:hypothetical protein